MQSQLTGAVLPCFRTPNDRQPVLQIVLLDDTNAEHSFQLFMEILEKWYPLRKFRDAGGSIHCTNAIINGKIYYASEKNGKGHLWVFVINSERSTLLYSSSDILRDTRMCLNGNFIYFCGGYKGSLPTYQVLKCDLTVRSVISLTPMKTKRAKAVAIFFQSELHVLGGYDGSLKLDSVEKYDPVTKKWTPLAPMLEKRRGHAVRVLNEKIYVCGGFGSNNVEFYESATNSWCQLQNMNKQRHDFLVGVYEGKLFSIGGDKEKTNEVYDPKDNRWNIKEDLSTGLQIKHPKGGLILPDCTPQRELQSTDETKNDDVAAKTHKKYSNREFNV